MSIRPENLHRYPADWPEISRRIRFERGGGRCECSGQCGLEHPGGRCPALHGQPNPATGATVWLTTAHLHHTPEDIRETNLIGACQRCHLRLDHGHHRVTASLTRATAAAAAGQLGLLPDTELTRTEPPIPRPPAPGRPYAAAQLQLPLPDPETEASMARITVRIEPLHSDGTVCEDLVKPSGKPRDPNSPCAGRSAYAVVCSDCGTVGDPHSLRVLAEPEQRAHRDSHKAALTTTG